MVNKLIPHILLLSILFLLSGCMSIFGTAEDKARNTGIRLLETNNDITERTKQLNSGANDVLENVPEEQRSAEEEIAILFTQENERIMGLPIERMDPLIVIDEYLSKKNQWENTWQELKAENTKLLRDREQLELDLQFWLEEARKEAEKGWFDKFLQWFFGLGVSGVVVMILLVIFFPTIGIPILTNIITFLIKAVPAMIGILGVVSKSAYDQTILGIERSRYRFKHDKLKRIRYKNSEIDRILENMNDGIQLYTPEEVEAILDENLKSAHDQSTGRIINQRKKALNGKFKL